MLHIPPIDSPQAAVRAAIVAEHRKAADQEEQLMAGLPNGVDDVMTNLPPKTRFFVPDDVLEVWFPPGAAAGVLHEGARKDAETYASRFGCKLRYSEKERAGSFEKK